MSFSIVALVLLLFFTVTGHLLKSWISWRLVLKSMDSTSCDYSDWDTVREFPRNCVVYDKDGRARFFASEVYSSWWDLETNRELGTDARQEVRDIFTHLTKSQFIKEYAHAQIKRHRG